MMEEGVLELADGRSLGYGVFGSPGAPPVVYCHGFPGNRFEFQVMEWVLERAGVNARVVVLERPGYGQSSFQPKRTLLEWPADVAAGADLLGLDEFAVLGVSGGGPYALACGYGLPERVTRLGLAVGMGPLEATGMTEAGSITNPPSNHLASRFQFGMVALLFQRGQQDRFFDQSLPTFSQPDQDFLRQPEIRQWFLAVMGESFVQGGRGSAWENTRIYRRPWGFDPEQIKVKTHLWYSGADITVPASAGQWLADRMPDANYKLWPDHGHFTWMAADEAADVFATTVA
jgi:pimeloyl-ACP methyl ester carboxylesterase